MKALLDGLFAYAENIYGKSWITLLLLKEGNNLIDSLVDQYLSTQQARSLMLR